MDGSGSPRLASSNATGDVEPGYRILDPDFCLYAADLQVQNRHDLFSSKAWALTDQVPDLPPTLLQQPVGP